jgi:DNA-binding protein H-NS
MKELDTLEQKLKQRQQEITQGLEMVGTMRKLMTATETTPALGHTNGKKQTTAANRTSPHMPESAKRKLRQASKQYWAKVRAGEIQRKGYNPNKTE